jgi:NAD(P)-dependent dehydrogenase (short-subunit alcohol dehydrogenase family)
MQKTKYILITGAMGGIATSTIQLLSNEGWHIFAADINPAILAFFKEDENITPLIVDITDAKSVEEAYILVESITSGLDAILNMAGLLSIGSLVELPVEEVKKVMDINLFGTYTINKQFLPLLINKKGRIINLSSEVGQQTAAPFNGAYSMSKHALEAYSDALRRELSFIDIKVIKIQPGPIKTAMTKNAHSLFKEAESNSILFKKNLAKGIPYIPKVYKNAKDPVIVARIINKALSTKNPKIAYLIKPDIPRYILDLLPDKWVDKIIKYTLS